MNTDQLGIYFQFVMFFILFLVFYDKLTNAGIVPVLTEVLYMIGSWFMLVINLFVMLFRSNGISTWFNEFFMIIFKTIGFFGSTVGNIIQGVMTGIIQFFGLIVKSFNGNSAIICLGTPGMCSNIPDVNNPPESNVIGLWARLNFNNGTFDVGGIFLTFNKVKIGDSVAFVQHDYLYFNAGLNFIKIGFFAKGFLIQDLGSVDWNLVSSITNYASNINNLFPSWEKIFDNLFHFGVGG